MNDLRFNRLAELLTSHSTRLQKGEHVLIEAFDVPEAFICAVIKAARECGAHPHVALRSTRVLRALVDGADEAGIEAWAAIDEHRMKKMDAYIGVRGSENASEMASVGEASMSLFGPGVSEACPLRRTSQADEVVRPSMAHTIDGSARRYEHR